MITNFTLTELDGYFSLQLFIDSCAIARVLPDSLDSLEIVHFADMPALVVHSMPSVFLCSFPLSSDCSQRLANLLFLYAEREARLDLSE